MRAHVPRQTALIGVGLEADLTLERLLARVQAHVLDERSLQDGGVLTDRALKGPHACKQNKRVIISRWLRAHNNT